MGTKDPTEMEFSNEQDDDEDKAIQGLEMQNGTIDKDYGGEGGLEPATSPKALKVSFQEPSQERSVGIRFSEDTEVIPPSTVENEIQQKDSEEQLSEKSEDVNDVSTLENDTTVNIDLTNINKGDDDDTDSEDEISLDIDDEIDDALDEGYMGMECTLERGFSLNESAIARDMRHERYDELYIDYHPTNSYTRYNPAIKHLIPRRKQAKNSDEMPIDKAGLYSFMSFSWMTPFMWKAYKTGLNEEDIPLCSKYDCADYNTQRLQHLWESELKEKGRENASLQRAVWYFLRTRLIISIIIFSITMVLGFIGPTIFMRYLIGWLSTEEPIIMGVYWTFGLILVEFFRIIFFALVWNINYRSGIRLRSACMGLLYKKIMRCSSLGNTSAGEVINLFANDAQRIYDFIVLGPLIVGGPLVAVGGIAYILWLLGPWALMGMLSFALFYPFQFVISRLNGYLRRKTIVVTDERVRMMNELLNSVKLIKMYAWEKSFANTIADIRCRERKLLEKSAYVQSISLAMAPTVPVIAAIVTFLAHVGAGYNLTAAQGLTVVAFFLGNVRQSFNAIRFSIRALVEGADSLRRIKKLLLLDELTPYLSEPQDKSMSIVFKDATLAWDYVDMPSQDKKKKRKKKKNKKSSNNDSISPAAELLPKSIEIKPQEVLHNININIKKGELVGVCGGVGSGKSSLISALLGHMRLQGGCVGVGGVCGYVGQQAWVLNTTFRDNILLGETFDAKRYYRVVHACSLNQDVSAMPAGDFTEIGERGINLSGGQKQRMSLARALYAKKEIYLLDDPLSAVDAHVGQHIFQWAIKGALKGKTTLFVTHQLQYLPQTDRVLYLRDGRVAEEGSHTELMEKNVGYAALYKQHMETVENEENKTKDKNENMTRNRKDSVMSTGSSVSQTSPAKGSKPQHKGGGTLMTEEKMDKGDIPASTIHSYIQFAGGYFVSCLVVLTFGLNVGSTAFSSWWLSTWLSHGSGNTSITVGNETFISSNIADNPDSSFYQTVYGCLILVILGTSLTRGFAFMKVSLHASSRMHDNVFVKVFRSPMSFFDTTPSGRIINIFSRDMDEIDVMLPNTLETFLQNLWLIGCSLMFVCLVFPHFVPILILLAVLFIFIRSIFRIGIRDFKRMENLSRSPLYSHVSTTVNGLATINAYGKQEMFTKKFMVLFDENSANFYLFNCALRWLAVRLDLLALLVTASTAMLSLLLRGSVDAAFAGLALAYSAQLSGIFQFTVRLSTETEARFTSVQRINNYIKGLVSEAPPIIESCRPEISWPKYGRVSFRNVEMRYRPETPLVLKGITIHVDEEEKIGVVGRTGSGKSSLGVALFRMVELASGKINIDHIDISTLGLEDLRSHLSIIPQDPTLFIGTIRYNLDPFDRHPDAAIWNALEQTYMKDTISAMPKGLLTPVIENGENFSVGERQLLCMARALLRNSKILFLDEATASIDTQTDAKIQKSLSEAFKHCTMITVAHRLNTVMSCSRVLVMDDGKVAEFDSPAALTANPKSAFAKMLATFETKAQ